MSRVILIPLLCGILGLLLRVLVIKRRFSDKWVDVLAGAIGAVGVGLIAMQSMSESMPIFTAAIALLCAAAGLDIGSRVLTELEIPLNPIGPQEQDRPPVTKKPRTFRQKWPIWRLIALAALVALTIGFWGRRIDTMDATSVIGIFLPLVLFIVVMIYDWCRSPRSTS